MILILIVIYLFIIGIDFLPRRRERGKKETVLYVVLLAVSFSVLILYCLGVAIPNPHKPIEYVVEKIGMSLL